MGYEPSFTCPFEKRIGSPGEGGKWICNPQKLRGQVTSREKCLVYSIGSHGQYDFETAVHTEVSSNCEIHTFDMKNWTAYHCGASPSFMEYHVKTIGDPKKRSWLTDVPTIVRELGHSGKVIDIFKIDCEGCEWSTFRHWFGAGVQIRQILIELHFYPSSKAVSTDLIHEFFKFLFDMGYVVFQKESNTLGCLGSC